MNLIYLLSQTFSLTQAIYDVKYWFYKHYLMIRRKLPLQHWESSKASSVSFYEQKGGNLDWQDESINTQCNQLLSLALIHALFGYVLDALIF